MLSRIDGGVTTSFETCNYARARSARSARKRKVQPQPSRLHMLEAVTGLQIVPATS
jgi:hypothetical protein